MGGEGKWREGREEISWWVVKEREVREKYVAFLYEWKGMKCKMKENISGGRWRFNIWRRGKEKDRAKGGRGMDCMTGRTGKGGGDSVEIFVNCTFSYLRQDIFIYLSVSGLLSPGVYLFLVFCQS